MNFLYLLEGLGRLLILGNCGSCFCTSIRCFKGHREIQQRTAWWETNENWVGWSQHCHSCCCGSNYQWHIREPPNCQLSKVFICWYSKRETEIRCGLWSTYLYVYYWCPGSSIFATLFIILPTYEVESHVLICGLMHCCQAANFIVNHSWIVNCELRRILNCNIQLSHKHIFLCVHIGI